MHGAQITMIAFLALGTGVSLARYGKCRTLENAWTTVISDGIVIGILYWGGFWS